MMLAVLLAAATYNGQWLSRECNRDESAVCDAYLAGYVDGKRKEIPTGLTPELFKPVVIRYLKDHPEQLEDAAGTVVCRALERMTTFFKAKETQCSGE